MSSRNAKKNTPSKDKTRREVRNTNTTLQGMAHRQKEILETLEKQQNNGHGSSHEPVASALPVYTDQKAQKAIAVKKSDGASKIDTYFKSVTNPNEAINEGFDPADFPTKNQNFVSAINFTTPITLVTPSGSVSSVETQQNHKSLKSRGNMANDFIQATTPGPSSISNFLVFEKDRGLNVTKCSSEFSSITNCDIVDTAEHPILMPLEDPRIFGNSQINNSNTQIVAEVLARPIENGTFEKAYWDTFPMSLSGASLGLQSTFSRSVTVSTVIFRIYGVNDINDVPNLVSQHDSASQATEIEFVQTFIDYRYVGVTVQINSPDDVALLDLSITISPFATPSPSMIENVKKEIYELESKGTYTDPIHHFIEKVFDPEELKRGVRSMLCSETDFSLALGKRICARLFRKRRRVRNILRREKRIKHVVSSKPSTNTDPSRMTMEVPSNFIRAPMHKVTRTVAASAPTAMAAPDDFYGGLADSTSNWIISFRPSLDYDSGVLACQSIQGNQFDNVRERGGLYDSVTIVRSEAPSYYTRASLMSLVARKNEKAIYGGMYIPTPLTRSAMVPSSSDSVPSDLVTNIFLVQAPGQTAIDIVEISLFVSCSFIYYSNNTLTNPIRATDYEACGFDVENLIDIAVALSQSVSVMIDNPSHDRLMDIAKKNFIRLASNVPKMIKKGASFAMEHKEALLTIAEILGTAAISMA